jgi:integrase
MAHKKKAEKKAGCWVNDPQWKHGRAWEDPDGRKTYYIRKQVGGVTYNLSTHCTSIVAAAAHLERFQRDPERYRADCKSTMPVYLDAETVGEFLAWSLAPEKADGKENTPAWVAKQKHYLAWWAEKLQGRNLRRVTVADHIEPAVDGASDRASRLRVLRSFYGWLVKKGKIEPTQDPTFRRLTIPKTRPAQWKKSKVVPREHFLLVRDALTAPWRDALIVQGATGWHTTEVVRFAAGGRIDPLPKAMIEDGVVAVLVCPLHKSGDEHRTRVTAEALEAAKRLREHGAFSREWYDRAVRSACKTIKCPDGSVGIPVFTPGRLRHTVATAAIEAGTDVAKVSAFLGHKSIETTKRFYATLAVVPKVPTLA